MKLSEAKKSKRTLLIIDDEKDVVHSFRRVLADEDYDFLEARSGEEGVELFRKTRPEVVLMDVRMKEMGGLAAMREIHKIDSKALVIIMTAYSSTQTAIEAMKAGACDYITKPFDIGKMKQLIQDAMRSSESMKSVVSYQPLLSKEDHAQGIIGKSEVMQSVYKEIGRVAAKNIAVLLTGETGTGKELVARAIYHHSDRPDRRFLAINCGAIPELLLESELFGHEKGAFTDAKSTKKGLFELADGGTIFLDEVGDMPPGLQAKILRFLEERTFRHVGGTNEISVDVRIIATTNRDLPAEVARGTFRQDLFFRLNVLPVVMPPLRQIIEELEKLATHLLEQVAAREGRPVKVFEPAALDLMRAYPWPGNVRELQNVCERAAVLTADDRISATLIQPWLQDRVHPRPAAMIEAQPLSSDLQAELGVVCDGALTLEDVEREAIVATLKRNHGHRQRSAAALGIGVRTLGLKLKKWKEQQIVSESL